MGDPVLDEISRRPLATYAANRMDREAGAQRDVALGEVANGLACSSSIVRIALIATLKRLSSNQWL